MPEKLLYDILNIVKEFFMKLKTKLIISFCIIMFVPMFMMMIVMMTIGNRQLRNLENDAKRMQVYELDQEKLSQSSESGEAGDSDVGTAGELPGALETGNTQEISELTTPGEFILGVRGLLRDMAVIVFIILLLTAILLLLWIYAGVNVPLNKLRKATHNIAEGNLNFTLDEAGDDEIGDLCRDFEEMRQRLLESTEEKLEYDRESKELISNISHDLKTPLTAIKGYVEGLMDGVADTPQKQERYIRTIYNKVNDMDRLINELTFYSKIDTNRIPYTFNKINVKGYFEDCCEEVGVELESKGFDFTYLNSVDEEVEVIADAEQIKRVINNIISNSVKYMDKDKGRIDIRVKDVGDFVQIEIEDNGRGIGQKELPNIFERFYRTDASRNSTLGGSGIGLSIVRKIIEDHGGKIWASSTLGKGTVMYFVLRKYQEVVL